MWKRFIKTRCSVISYYWHKSSLVLSFSVSSILQDVFIESGQNPFKYAQNRLKFDIPFSVFPTFQHLAIFIWRLCVLQTFLDFDSTESLLDAAVPFIALRPRIESMWR